VRKKGQEKKEMASGAGSPLSLTSHLHANMAGRESREKREKEGKRIKKEKETEVQRQISMLGDSWSAGH